MYQQSVHDRLLETASAQDFPYDDVDRHLIEENPDYEECQELARQFSAEERSSELASSSLQSIGGKAVALLWMLQSERCNIAGQSLSDLSKRLGCTRALLSYDVRRLEDAISLHARGQMPLSARQSFREGVQKGWQTRRAKQAG